MESLESMRSLLAAGRPKASSLGYSPAVRHRVATYVQARHAAGAKAQTIAGELGISRHSVIAWAKLRGHERLRSRRPAALARSAPGSSPARLVPVEVLEDGVETVPTQAKLPGRPDISAPGRAPSVVLVSPRGFRVEGLDVEALGTLLERLG